MYRTEWKKIGVVAAFSLLIAVPELNAQEEAPLAARDVAAAKGRATQVREASAPGGWGEEYKGFQGVRRSLFLLNLTIFDADSDGMLSKEEFEKGMAELFEILDTNTDGKLTGEEVTRNLGKLWLDPSSRAQEIFRLYDLNRDNKISQDECLLPGKLFAMIDADKTSTLEESDLVKLPLSKIDLLMAPESRGALLLADLDKDNDGKLAADEWTFDKAILEKTDKNSDGGLDANELKSLPPLPLGHPERRAQDLISKLDKDGDKKLSAEEANRSGVPFDMADENKDGSLDLKELVVWFQSRGGQYMRQDAIERRVEMLMSRFDKDKNGKITGDEMEGIPEQMRESWDRNSDGTIDAEEVEISISAPMRGRGFGPAGMAGPEMSQEGARRGTPLKKEPPKAQKPQDDQDQDAE